MTLTHELDKIDSYRRVMVIFDFHENEDLKFIHKKSIIEIKEGEWILNKSNRRWTGKTPDELKRTLLGFMTKKELIDLLMW